MTSKATMSIHLCHRLSSYLRYLKHLPPGSPSNISSTAIAIALEVGDVQVRKDLAIASTGGKPKIGYITEELISDLEHFLGYDVSIDAVLIGAGHLGKAFLSYENFQNYGLKIVAAFDADPLVVGTEYNGICILDSAKIANLCERLHVMIGIITVPAVFAQDVCDQLIAGGVRAIWNFAPANLRVPDNVIVRNEDMAASLAVLTRQLAESPRPNNSFENRMEDLL